MPSALWYVSFASCNILDILWCLLNLQILSPLQELPSLGRNPVYITTIILFAVLQIPTALSNNIAGLLVLRFIAGFLGSPALATGGASVGDM